MHAYGNVLTIQETGHVFNTADGSQVLNGTIAIVSADNPASNIIGGFKESPSAYRPCRHCLGSSTEIREEV